MTGKLGKNNYFVTIFYALHTATTPTKREIYLRANTDVRNCSVNDQMNRAFKLVRIGK